MSSGIYEDCVYEDEGYIIDLCLQQRDLGKVMKKQTAKDAAKSCKEEPALQAGFPL
jgi:hypothetical protein